MEWRTTGRPAKRPGIIEPCIPTRLSKPPVGPQWAHEIKHDGYRLIARKRDGRVRLFTRCGFDWTERYPRISAAVERLQPASVTIDGEAVVCDDAGVAVFEKLYSCTHGGEAFLYAFDLLELDGEDWRPRPLEERKAPGSKGCSPRRRRGSNTASIWRVTARPSLRMPASSAPRASFPNTASVRIARDRARPGSRSRIPQRRA
jgi:ATP dependent DNA ligase domain